MMIDRSFLVSQVLGLAGMACLGLGIAGFMGSAGAIHPALDGRETALGLVAAGAVLVMLELRLLIPALRRRARQQGPGGS